MTDHLLHACLMAMVGVLALAFGSAKAQQPRSAESSLLGTWVIQNGDPSCAGLWPGSFTWTRVDGSFLIGSYTFKCHNYHGNFGKSGGSEAQSRGGGRVMVDIGSVRYMLSLDSKGDLTGHLEGHHSYEVMLRRQ